MTQVEWLGKEMSAGCVERSFLLRRGSGTVPGVLWSPETSAAPPLMLLFHGGSGHKHCDRHLRMGRWLASAAGLAVLAIDGPHHGDRVPAPMPPSVYQQLIADEGIERVTDRMTKDWLETVSALGSRLRCAVLGKFGIRQAGALHAGLCAPGLIVEAARRISAPVLYHVQWDDEIFPRDGQFELFGALASTDKRLNARPGPHARTHPDDEASWQEFIRLDTAGPRTKHSGRD